RVIQCYADIVAMRHPKEGMARLASEYSGIPIINAGDGSNEHPSQTMLDLYTIKQRLGRLDNFVIGFCGDLKYGRTVHSLTQILNKYYSGIEFYFISPEELKMPDRFLEENMKYSEVNNLETTIDKLDILYMTRIQQERFSSKEEYMRFNGVYVLDENKMKRAKNNMAVLHPFPRVNEILLEVDKDPRAAYFDQVQNGLYIRMALIMALLGIKDPISGQLILD
ncbi:MAG: aspartate carbamoyltransferase, partial [Oscillospiraceae bacterium]